MKLTTIFQLIKKFLKYILILYLIINIAIYIYVFLFQENPDGEILDNVSERNKRSLLALILFNGILFSIIKGEEINSWF